MVWEVLSSSQLITCCWAFSPKPQPRCKKFRLNKMGELNRLSGASRVPVTGTKTARWSVCLNEHRSLLWLSGRWRWENTNLVSQSKTWGERTLGHKKKTGQSLCKNAHLGFAGQVKKLTVMNHEKIFDLDSFRIFWQFCICK